MSERLTSRSNPLFVHLHKLQTSRSYRAQTRQFCADGVKLLDEAVRWYPGLHTVIACDGLALPDLPEDVRLVRVPEGLMQSISTMRTPQGVVFLCRMPEEKPLCIEPGSLILDTIQDPGNLGTILRTADALGVNVVLSDGCADPYGEKTVRASMGAVLRTQPQSATAGEILACCAENAVELAVTALTDDAEDLRAADPGRYAVVIGSEGQGVRAAFIQNANKNLIIPMLPRCESLNAAVAAAIVMWEMRR